MRDNVKWSDGSTMTADDVAYSFQIMKDNKGVNYYALPITRRVDQRQPVTVKFDGSQYVNRTKILSTQVINKKQWSAMADPSKDTVANPIGTGPYTIKSVTPVDRHAGRAQRLLAGRAEGGRRSASPPTAATTPSCPR